MNSTQPQGSIASNSTNCKTNIADRIQERNRRRILDALADGCDYLQMKKSMCGDSFKIWLESIGKTAAEATKYAKLYQVFVDFPISQIAQLSLSTLFALCQKRYQQLVALLRSLPPQTEAQVQQLMAQERELQKTEKPKRDCNGLINLPSGGRAFQFPLLHDDETIAKVLRLLERREDVTPVGLLREAIALLFQYATSINEGKERNAVAQEDRNLRHQEEHLKDYKIGAIRLKDWQHNARVLQRVKEQGIVNEY